jgi:hypothetical protein
MAELVRIASARWAVEECFQAANDETVLKPLALPGVVTALRTL